MREQVQVWNRKMWERFSCSNINYRVLERVRGPQVFTYCITIDPTALSKVYGMAEQLAFAFGVDSVRIGRTRNLLNIELSLPKKLHSSILLRNLVQPARKTRITIGCTQTGSPVSVDFAGTRTSQTQIAGATGSGKTNTQRVILEMLARKNKPDDVGVMLIDAKGSPSWKAFSRLAHLIHPIILNVEDAIGGLAWVLAELLRRKDNGQSSPKIFVFVDETKLLIDTGGNAVSNAISTIASAGREMGIHLILATQYPLVGAVGGGAAKANLPVRLTGTVASAKESAIATGIPSAGAQKLAGHGDFLLNVGGGIPHRLCIGLQVEKDLETLRRWDNAPALDIGGFNLDNAPTTKATPLDPDHVAVAVTSGRGISYLKDTLRIGSAKATRVKNFAELLLAAMRQRGYGIRRLGEC